MLTPAQCAIAASAAEAMFSPGVLAPRLDARLTGWNVLGYLTGVDQLIGRSDSPLFYGIFAEVDGEYVVDIRGTETFAEWAIDARFAMTSHAKGGNVEYGFWSIYSTFKLDQNSRSTAAADIARTLASKGVKNITVTGHSLGSALATYLILDLQSYGLTVRGRLFASPKPGDDDFAALFKPDPFTDVIAYTFVRDIVPRFPITILPFFAYQSLPLVVWLREADVGIKLERTFSAAHNAMNYARLLGWGG